MAVLLLRDLRASSDESLSRPQHWGSPMDHCTATSCLLRKWTCSKHRRCYLAGLVV